MSRGISSVGGRCLTAWLVLAPWAIPGLVTPVRGQSPPTREGVGQVAVGDDLEDQRQLRAMLGDWNPGAPPLGMDVDYGDRLAASLGRLVLPRRTDESTPRLGPEGAASTATLACLLTEWHASRGRRELAATMWEAAWSRRPASPPNSLTVAIWDQIATARLARDRLDDPRTAAANLREYLRSTQHLDRSGGSSTRVLRAARREGISDEFLAPYARRLSRQFAIAADLYGRRLITRKDMVETYLETVSFSTTPQEHSRWFERLVEETKRHGETASLARLLHSRRQAVEETHRRMGDDADRALPPDSRRLLIQAHEDLMKVLQELSPAAAAAEGMRIAQLRAAVDPAAALPVIDEALGLCRRPPSRPSKTTLRYSTSQLERALLNLKAKCLFEADQFGESARLLSELLQSGDDAAEKARLSLLLAEARMLDRIRTPTSPDADEVRGGFEQAGALAEEVRDVALRHRAKLGEGQWELLGGHYDAASQVCEEVLREVGVELEAETRARLLQCLAAKNLGDFPLAEQQLDSFQAKAAAHPLLSRLAICLRVDLALDRLLTDNEAKLETREHWLRDAVLALEQFANLPEKSIPDRVRRLLAFHHRHQRALLEWNQNRAQEAIREWESLLAASDSDDLVTRARTHYFLALAHLRRVESADGMRRSYSRERERFLGELREELLRLETLEPNEFELERQTSELRLRRRYEELGRLYREVDAVTSSEELRLAEEAARAADGALGDSQSYPNLRYNLHCCLARLWMRSDPVRREVEIHSRLSQAREIATRLRAEVIGDQRRFGLFQQYQLAFDMSVDYLVARKQQPEALDVALSTTNRNFQETAMSADERQGTAELLRSIPRGDVFIAYYLGGRQSHVFWTTGREGTGELDTEAIPLGRKELADAINDYFGRLSTASSEPVSSAVARSLAQLLPPRLRERLQRVENGHGRAWIMPHGPLFHLPLETIPLGDAEDGPKYVFDIAPPLIYLPCSPSSRPWLPRRLPDRRLFALRYEGAGEEIAGEAETIAELFGTQAISGQRWREPEVQRVLCSSRLVYFGAHGRLEQGSNEGELLLASVGAPLVVRVSELRGLDLCAEFLVLAACNTGSIQTANARFGGETINALSSACLLAGANHVAASHWEVEDSSTARIFNRVFAELRRLTQDSPAVPPDFARLLRDAKREVQRGAHSQPYQWGAFTFQTLQIGASNRGQFGVSPAPTTK